MSEETIDLEVEFWNSDGPRVRVQQRYFGMSPAVLIEPEIDDDDNITIKMIAVDLEKDELADMLELLAENIRRGEVTVSESEDVPSEQ